MADIITADERAAIDAALAAKKYSTIPAGVSGLPAPRWDASSKTWYSVCPKTGRRLSPREARRSFVFGSGKKRSLAVKSRRAKVRAMASNKTVHEIAKTLEVPETTVRTDLASLGLKALPACRKHVVPTAKSKAAVLCHADAQRKATDAKVREVVQPGLSLAEIARRAGVNEKTVYAVFRRNGWTTPRERQRNLEKQAAS